ncbi:MAG: hypothetical protein Q9185_005904 [Variospora sp. 1 TL-2023]
MGNPRLITILEAVNLTAERAWNRLENRGRCKPASEEDRGVGRDWDRTEDDNGAGDGSNILIAFSNKPKNLEKGFVFGSDPRFCHVILGGRGAGFSRQHFRITFNERGEVVFENTSRKIASVKYRGEALSPRNHFTWILFERYHAIDITVDGLIFKAKRPVNHIKCLAEYGAHRDAYLEGRRSALPSISQLGVESQQTTALLTAQLRPSVSYEKEPTQIKNPPSEDKGTSTLSKRWRPQPTQSPTADPVGKGQSKRARASVSCEASKQLSKASNPRPGPERSIDPDPGGPFTIDAAGLVQETAPIPHVAPEFGRDRAISLLGRSSAQPATVNSIETEKPSLKRNVHNDVRAMLDEDLDGEDEGTTRILTLANKNASDRKYLISLVKEQTKVQVLPATAGVHHPCSWVNFPHELILCKYLELEHQLQPLINYGLRAQRDGSQAPESIYDCLTEV